LIAIYSGQEYAGFRKWLVNLNPEELRKPKEIYATNGGERMHLTMRQSIIANQGAKVVETMRETNQKSLVASMKPGICSSIAFQPQRCSSGS
jgi:hypothetical protein